MENCSTNSSTNSTDGDLSPHDQQILLETFTCAITFFLPLSFLIGALQNRLWRKNRFINLLLKIIEDPLVPYILNLSIYLVLDFPFRNHLYFLWAVLLLIGFDSTSCISGYSLPNAQTAKMMYYMLFVNNLIVGILIWSNWSKFRVHLWVLWILITLKMAVQFLSFLSARRAYGMNMIDLVSDYMQYEHTLSSPEEVDPAKLQGYKYLVHGEAGAKLFKISSDYQVNIDEENKKLVTIDKIWRCETGLLSPGSGRLKDLCLSFALFKLLRRSFVRSPASESEQPKTRDLVFRGILGKDDEGDRAFEVVKTELAFLRDLFHTKYPIIFGCGFPTVYFILSLGVLGVMGWLCKVVYHDYHHHTPNCEMVHHVGKHNVNVDLYITYLVVGMIVVMEVIECLTYLFSDWAKVMLVCDHFQGSWLLQHISLSKMLRFICAPTFSQALCSDIGQHSLLDNSNSSACSSCSILGRRLGRGKNQNTRVKVPPEVKMAIATSLRQSQGNLSNGGSSLQRNGVSGELGWACELPTLLHTIMVWHIATHYCEMKYNLEEKSTASAPTDEMLQRNKRTANALSQYCVYLLVSAPDMLPISARPRHDTKLVLDKIMNEIRDFMNGAITETDKYDRMNQVGNEETAIAFGSRLGKQLGSISLYGRWKVLADLWAELLLYLAPTDNPDTHLKKLADGGEFITQVWILLYHAGILKQPLPTTNIDV